MRRASKLSFLCTFLLSVATACSGAAPAGEGQVSSAENADDGPDPIPHPPIPPSPPQNRDLQVLPQPSTCPPGQFPPTQEGGPTRCTYAAGACTWILDNAPCSFDINLPGDYYTYVWPLPYVYTTALALGAHTTYVLGVGTEAGSTRGAVYSWGLNADYELGNGTNTPWVPGAQNLPVVTLWVEGNPVTAIAAGDEDACALLSDGTVQCWGTIATIPSAIVEKTPTPIVFPSGIVNRPPTPDLPLLPPPAPKFSQLVHGQNHACGLANAGSEVYCWGNNDKQQLGDASNSAGRATPFKVPLTLGASTTIVGLAAGGRSTCALESNATVWCWGDNERGSLGNARAVLACPNSPYPCPSPVQGSATSYTAIPQSVVSPTDPVSGDPVTFVVPTAGGSSTLIGGGAGTFCAQTLDSVTEAADGWFCWGANDQGQAGIQLDGVNLTTDQPSALKTRPGVNQAPFIAVGMNHSCVGGGSTGWPLSCFGANNAGQLGDGTTTASFSPETVLSQDGFSLDSTPSFAVGANHSCVILNESLVCWGSNDSGQSFTTVSPLEASYVEWNVYSDVTPPSL